MVNIKLAMYLWIKYLIYSDSLVLMDEPDIALHPKWQYDLINDLTMWSNNKNQFLTIFFYFNHYTFVHKQRVV